MCPRDRTFKALCTSREARFLGEIGIIVLENQYIEQIYIFDDSGFCCMCYIGYLVILNILEFYAYRLTNRLHAILFVSLKIRLNPINMQLDRFRISVYINLTIVSLMFLIVLHHLLVTLLLIIFFRLDVPPSLRQKRSLYL